MGVFRSSMATKIEEPRKTCVALLVRANVRGACDSAKAKRGMQPCVRQLVSIVKHKGLVSLLCLCFLCSNFGH
jgi:hypothetical protein